MLGETKIRTNEVKTILYRTLLPPFVPVTSEHHYPLPRIGNEKIRMRKKIEMNALFPRWFLYQVVEIDEGYEDRYSILV